jgi:hypothetical protein
MAHRFMRGIAPGSSDSYLLNARSVSRIGHEGVSPRFHGIFVPVKQLSFYPSARKQWQLKPKTTENL